MVQAGWYADPAGRHPHRYWDGARWTEHVAGPAGQGVDPLPPAPRIDQHSADAQPGDSAPATPSQQAHATPPAQQQVTSQAVHADPAELQGVLGELGIHPVPSGDGTPFGERMLILTFSAERPDALEWWTPAGRLVAVATILEKQKPGSLDAPSNDPQSGAMIGTRIEVAGADGSPIATTVRTLKPTKPPTYVDAPNGQRLVSVAQEKVFSKIASYAVTAPNGAPIGRLVATDMRGKAVVLSDNSGGQLATVVKYGKWDGANVALEFSRNRPFQTPTEWLASRAASTLFPIKRERVCSVVIRDRPPADASQALLGFLAPLLLEHTLSIL